ncbi:hypothetical protein BCR39DRAFT_557768 [Naematelia encephala]|uniref:Methyltransferase domain-containing protein n=1 Tax=Naematelia encephala TaxID=71784 RepID=A0A1Y2BBA4_9TREE|nr:hypothetical protein BCR39DRAFT_557768 [Naematelia encephala]
MSREAESGTVTPKRRKAHYSTPPATIRKSSGSDSTGLLLTRMLNSQTTSVLNELDTSEAADEGYFTSWRGRRIRKAGVGGWACDEAELERQDSEHWLLRLLLGHPFVGPVREVLHAVQGRPRILDITTGTGAWAIEMADMFPLSGILSAR